jgi:hypothetical protein
MAFISTDVVTPPINPQVLHTPFNTGVDGYAHAMHSFMNNTPLEYSPATFSVVGARGDGRCFRTATMRAAQQPAEEPANGARAGVSVP